jgi:nucleoside-diphosphate-sugar epimerase
MKKAIVTGATGLIGLTVAQHLCALGIDTLCLGRKYINPHEVINYFGQTAKYIQISMENIQSLEMLIDEVNWSPGDACVFFNFAWSGDIRLTDGNFDIQLNNSINAAQAVRTAKKMGCVKFVNSGSLEETFLEQHLNAKVADTYKSSQTDYALAKLACRDMCKMVAYVEQIDYVHTRLSVPLSPDLSRGTYVSKTLKKIIKGEPFTPPENINLFDFILTTDVAKAYELIGKFGKNKANYYIGTSQPRTLSSYFDSFKQHMESTSKKYVGKPKEHEIGLFSTEEVYRDTGFQANKSFETILLSSTKI